MERDNEQGDLLYGYEQIAAHLGLGRRQVEHLANKGSIPTFRMRGNRRVCALRSKLDAWLADTAAQSMVEGGGDRGGE